MKNERGIYMKKLLCLLLALCLLPACAFAVSVEDFNMYASIFGEPELDTSSGKTSNSYIFFESEDCIISFKEENGEIKTIIVNGDGIPFIVYSMAAIMAFDQDSSNFTDNAGRFMTMFLLNRTATETETGYLPAGYYYAFSKDERGYVFLIGK